MTLAELIAVGKTAGEVFSKLLDKLPDDEQRVLREYFEFKDTFNQEVSRKDQDFDTMMAYLERSRALDKGFVGEILKNNNS